MPDPKTPAAGNRADLLSRAIAKLTDLHEHALFTPWSADDFDANAELGEGVWLRTGSDTRVAFFDGAQDYSVNGAELTRALTASVDAISAILGIARLAVESDREVTSGDSAIIEHALTIAASVLKEPVPAALAS